MREAVIPALAEALDAGAVEMVHADPCEVLAGAATDGAVCYLTAQDVGAVEAELRRQLAEEDGVATRAEPPSTHGGGWSVGGIGRRWRLRLRSRCPQICLGFVWGPALRKLWLDRGGAGKRAPSPKLGDGQNMAGAFEAKI